MISVVLSLLPRIGSTSSIIGRGKCVYSSLKKREEAGTWGHFNTKVTKWLLWFLCHVFDAA